MARSLDLFFLVSQPEAQRDEEWEKVFFQAFVESKLAIEQPDPQMGPDGWPYLLATTDSNAKEPAIRIIDWLSKRGIGLALNTQKMVPDYVFTYGMLWNFKERGQFISEQEQTVPATGEVEMQEGQEIIAGTPTKEYLPTYVRKILRQFFKDQKVEDPKILVMSTDKKHYDLCFSLESLGNPDPKEHQGIAEALAWFLPTHYSIMIASEKGLPPFVNL